MGFSRQEYWSGLPFPSPGDLPDPGIEPGSPALEADALTSEPPGKPPLVSEYRDPLGPVDFLLQGSQQEPKALWYSGEEPKGSQYSETKGKTILLMEPQKKYKRVVLPSWHHLFIIIRTDERNKETYPLKATGNKPVD